MSKCDVGVDVDPDVRGTKTYFWWKNPNLTGSGVFEPQKPQKSAKKSTM
jgi:hypothetical protein